jgi:hypothetical protein
VGEVHGSAAEVALAGAAPRGAIEPPYDAVLSRAGGADDAIAESMEGNVALPGGALSSDALADPGRALFDTGADAAS